MQQSITLRDVRTMFDLDSRSRGFTAHTLRFYAGRLGLFLRWCDTERIIYVEDLTHTAIRRYLASLQERQLSTAYVHSHARAIRTFCRFMAREELTATNPFARVKMPRLEKKILSALTGEEVHRILAACDTERDKTIILFTLDSGVHASELCSLTIDDVTEDGIVTVRKGKGQKDRVTFIGAKTRKQLHRYYALERGGKPEAGEPLFAAQRSYGPLTYSGLAQLARRLRRRSGVKNCSLHAFRRTMAIQSLRNGMNIYVLARMMGHTEISVLRSYLDMLQDDIQAAASTAGVVDNLL